MGLLRQRRGRPADDANSRSGAASGRRKAGRTGIPFGLSGAAGIEQTRRTAAEMIGGIGRKRSLSSPIPRRESAWWRKAIPGARERMLLPSATSFLPICIAWMNLASRGVRDASRSCRWAFVPDLTRLLEDLRRADSHHRHQLGWLCERLPNRRWGTGREPLTSAVSWFCLDVIQGLGVFPVERTRYATSTSSPPTATNGCSARKARGFCMSGAIICRTLRPLNVGWNSVVHKHDYSRVELNLCDTAARYEGGSQNMVGLLGLGASLNLLSECGVGPNESAVGDRVLEISDFACERLQRGGRERLQRSSVRDTSLGHCFIRDARPKILPPYCASAAWRTGSC